MYRPLLAAGLLILAPAMLGANAEFVTPVRGAQVLGVAALEVRVPEGGVEKVTFYVDGVIVGVSRAEPYRALHDFGSVLEPHTIVAEVVSKGYGHIERISVTTSGTTINDAIEVNLVEVPLRVRGGGRAPMPADLRVSENGVDQKILEIRERRGEMTFIFVVDRSLSMGDGKLETALRSVRDALSGLRPGDDAELALFNHRNHAPVLLTRDSAIEPVEPAGGTALRDALASIQPQRRSAIVVITDGGDRNSAMSDEQALRAVGRANGVVYALALSGGDGADFLRTAAARTGGTFSRTSVQALGGDLMRIIDEINSRYTVVYQSSLTGPGWRDIRVEPARRGLTLSAARRGYYAR